MALEALTQQDKEALDAEYRRAIDESFITPLFKFWYQQPRRNTATNIEPQMEGDFGVTHFSASTADR